MDIKALLAKIYPTKHTCMLCLRDAVVNEYNICEKCFDSLEPFGKVLRRSNITEMKAAFVYNKALSKAIWNFKYDEMKFIAETFARFMEPDPRWDIDCVTVVPLTEERQRWRGYNQCTELARFICEREKLELDENLLVKQKETNRQAKLTASERRENLKGAFRANAGCKGRSVMLIDDVITTGSTVSECAKALKRAGAKEVFVLALAIVENNKIT